MITLEDITDPGLRQLGECLAEVIRAEIARSDPTRPITAKEMCERWAINAATPELQLHILARRTREWGLRPMKGTRGWDALYCLADVLKAQSYGAGKSTRRQHAA